MTDIEKRIELEVKKKIQSGEWVVGKTPHMLHTIETRDELNKIFKERRTKGYKEEIDQKIVKNLSLITSNLYPYGIEEEEKEVWKKYICVKINEELNKLI